MKAILFTRYGSPDVLQLSEVEKPVPAENQVLVKVVAAAANPLDWHRMRADPFLVRLGGGLFRPKNPRLGADLAGIVEAVGSNVAGFRPGDEVFGEIGAGAFAEYACVHQKYLSLKPANISFAQAAATPIAGFTALQGLRDTGKIRAGQRVLVNGASGGVGSCAVQIAKAYGTEVTGVSSSRNLELVRSIGADHVVDYTQEDFTRIGRQYDLVYDAVGNRSVSDYKRALAPGGICVIAGFSTMARLFEHLLLGPLLSIGSGKKVGMMSTAQSNTADRLVLKEMLEKGQIAPVIDRTYPLAETAEAIHYLETGRARGKVIIAVTPEHD